MNLNKKYTMKYLHDATIAQLADEYKAKGYEVRTEEKIGDYRADLVVRKDNEQLVIEVKTGKMSPTRRNELAGLTDYLNEIGGYKFHLVIANGPKEKEIHFEGIEEVLTKYVFTEPPHELDELSTHTRPDEIVRVQIDKISIKRSAINVVGIGVIGVELQFGSDGDQDKGDGFKTNDNFPFDFDIDLEYFDSKWSLSSVNHFQVDTSSYYE